MIKKFKLYDYMIWDGEDRRKLVEFIEWGSLTFHDKGKFTFAAEANETNEQCVYPGDYIIKCKKKNPMKTKYLIMPENEFNIFFEGRKRITSEGHSLTSE